MKALTSKQNATKLTQTPARKSCALGPSLALGARLWLRLGRKTRGTRADGGEPFLAIGARDAGNEKWNDPEKPANWRLP